MRGLRQREPDLKSLAVACDRSRRVAKICELGIALHVADSFVSRRQLALQIRNVAGLLGKAVEVLQRIVDKGFSRACRSWQILDLVVNIEELRVGQFAHIVETP